MDWWFCLKHQVAECGPGCPNDSRLGPYPDEAAAAAALQRMAQREADQLESDED